MRASVDLLCQLERSPTDLRKLVRAVQRNNLRVLGIPPAAITRWKRADPRSWATVSAWLRFQGVKIVTL